MSRNPSALLGLKQTDTLAFREWFEGSQVVDPSGRPRVVYHGGFRDIQDGVFDRLRSTQWRRPSMDTVGSWFSDNPSDDGGAGMYASGEDAVIYPVYLSIKRPKTYVAFKDFLREMHEAEGRKLQEQNPPGLGSTEGLRNKLMAQGYDGILFARTQNQELMDVICEYEGAVKRARADEFSVPRAERPPFTMKRDRLEKHLLELRKELAAFGSSTEFDKQNAWVAFEPTQIKSATGNLGAFCPDNPDIRFSSARERER